MAAALVLFLAALQDPKAPEGFEIRKVAESAFPMFGCFDDQGRLYVTESSGGDLYLELAKQVRGCRIRRFEKDFKTSTVFAENLTPSMGIAWREGKIYVADPPDLAVLEDKDGDGKADQRTVLLTGFGHKDNGSLHGITFGPDGLLYGTMGEPDGYKLKARDGSILTGMSGMLFRCRPDGSDAEVLCRGFENLVEIVFLPNGDILGTCNWYQKPSGGIRDAIVHLVPGGLYPYVPDTGTKYPFTGEVIPPLALFPAVALSGICRDGETLYTAQHNSRKVQRHLLTKSGASYTSRDLDFVTSENPDFHPSDVLVAPDGSLIVIDTGAWYVQHCPTGKIRNSRAPGGIYRVTSTQASIGPKKPDLREGVEAEGVWRHSLNRTEDGFGWTSGALEGPQPDVAARVAGRLGEKMFSPKLTKMLSSKDASRQLAAAEALATCGTAESLPAIWEALAATTDRFVEHQLVHAASFLADRKALEEALKDESPRVQKAAIVLLDQKGGAPEAAVIRGVGSGNPDLRKAALRILQNHPEWSGNAIVLVQAWLRKTEPAPDELEALRGSILAFQGDPTLQRVVGEALRDGSPSGSLLLSTIGETTLPTIPDSWKKGLGRALPAIVAIRAIQALQIPDFDDELVRIARQPFEQTKAVGINWMDTRLAALRTVVTRRPDLPSDLVDVASEELGSRDWPMRRLAASEILARSRLTDRQAARALEKIRGDTLVAPATILAGLASVTAGDDARALLDGVRGVIDGGWRPSDQELDAVLRRFPAELQTPVDAIRELHRRNTGEQRARLESLQPLLSGGDPAKGRAVFFGKKVACSACHAIGAEGGRIGPDLTKIGAIRAGRDLLESIVVPSSTFAQGYEPFLVATKDGDVLGGLIARQDADAVVLKDASGSETRVRRDRIRDLKRAEKSIMPEGLDRALTSEEFRDLLNFLQSLK